MEGTFKAYVNNIPDYPLDKYVVARYDSGELWFWGSYQDKGKAIAVSREVSDGIVLENDTD